ncbi:hypothetical protein [Helicobacter cetorum]|uniref:hypothetical protein n=1 Tax=Helicobacter cetorum TaxID=138563 RepID=UPI00131503E6|nr:hypothetical protein [Helicobacter cetorum]
MLLGDSKTIVLPYKYNALPYLNHKDISETCMLHSYDNKPWDFLDMPYEKE